MQSRSRWSPVRVVSAVLAVYVLTPMMIGTESCPSPGYAASGWALETEDLPFRIPAKRALRVGTGTAMSVTLEDSTELRGVYLGRSQLDDEVYRVRFDAWRVANPGSPELRSPIDLVHGDGSMERAVFLGFTYRAVEVERGSPPRRARVPFSHFRALRVLDGREWSTDELATFDARGELPSREALQIGRHPYRTWQGAGGFGIGEEFVIGFGDTALVAVDLVRWVEVPTHESNTALGVVAGMALGAAIVVLIVQANRQHTESTQCDEDLPPMFGSRLAEPATLDFDTRAGTYVEPASVDSAAGAPGAMNPEFALREAR